MTAREERMLGEWLIAQVANWIAEGVCHSSLTFEELVREAQDVNGRYGFTFIGPPVGWFAERTAPAVPEQEQWTIREGLHLSDGDMRTALAMATRLWETLVDSPR
jgi:hypothetical protein